MKQLLLASAILLLSGCGRLITIEPVPTDPIAAASPTPTPITERPDRELERELAALIEGFDGEVGVGAMVIETGESAYVHRDGRFPMMSVYKLPISMAVLKLVDEGRIKLDQEMIITREDFVRPGFHSPIRNMNPGGTVMPLDEILSYSISESDGTASDVLLEVAGGPGEVQKYLASIGLSDGMVVADSEKSIGKDWETQYRNWSTPEASVNLLAALQTRQAGLSERTTELLLGTMVDTETGRRRLKAGLPKDTTLAHKTGTGGTKDGVTGATNDIGIVTLPNGNHVALAVFVKDSRADLWSRENIMARIAEAVWSRWAE
ncbi:MAG TPA: class A beta-lactamase [Pyrinomonadaceae bacterium]|nr:class A beta-lactamase [Pyrinomonadaceae bacterium]